MGFLFCVKESLDSDDAIESTTEYSVLTSLIADVADTASAETATMKTLITAAETANTAAQNVVDGKSAYELALDGGFVGTVSEWIASLEGDKGDQGNQGNPGIVYQPEEPTDPDTFVWISDEDSPVLDPETLALKQDLDALQDEVIRI